MTKKILLLVDKYWPVMGANEICINKLLGSNKNLETYTICRVELETVISSQMNRIYPVVSTREKKFSHRGFISKISYVIKHFWGSLFLEPVDAAFCKKMYEKADEIISDCEIDTIISIINPAEAAETGYLLKKQYPEKTFIIYDLDTVSNCSTGIIERKLYYFYSKRVYGWETKVFSCADLIIHLTQHKDHFLQEEYKRFREKTIFQNLPLLEICENREAVYNKHPILIYSGSFYNRLREPEKLIDPFIKLSKKIDFELHIYTNKEYVITLRKMYSQYHFLKVYDYIEEEILIGKIMKSDYLVSLGNSYSNMFPSKIVMYVSMLKPIIHICQQEGDPVIPFLENYPDRLLYNSIKADEQEEELRQYLQSSHKKIQKEDVETIYKRNSPHYCMKMIEDKLGF